MVLKIAVAEKLESIAVSDQSPTTHWFVDQRLTDIPLRFPFISTKSTCFKKRERQSKSCQATNQLLGLKTDLFQMKSDMQNLTMPSSQGAFIIYVCSRFLLKTLKVNHLLFLHRPSFLFLPTAITLLLHTAYRFANRPPTKGFDSSL